LDATAAGYGWFLDPMPGDDSAFGNIVAPFELQASPGSPAFGRMDLLTVVEHELGHVLGLSDLDPQAVPHALMTQTLDTGVRRLPAPASVVAPTPVLSALPGVSQVMETVPASPIMDTGSNNAGVALGNGATGGVSSGDQSNGTAVGPPLVAMPILVVGSSGSAGMTTTPFGAAVGERLGEPASPQSPGLVVGVFDRDLDPAKWDRRHVCSVTRPHRAGGLDVCLRGPAEHANARCGR
jgi:hypothetical protein